MTDTPQQQSTFGRLWSAAWSRPSGRWPVLRWGLGMLIPVALVMWGLTALLMPDDPELLTIVVDSQATGNTIEGASVAVGGIRYMTDAGGKIVIEPVPAGTEVMVAAAGHESARMPVPDDEGEAIRVSLSAVLVLGSISDIVSGVPVEGAEISVLDAGGDSVASTRTDESGTFVFKFIPEDAEIVITDDVYGEYRQPLQQRRSLQIQLDPPRVEGQVVNADGGPVAGARVSGPQVDTRTGDDGTFSLDGVGQGTEIAIRKDGVGVATVTVSGTDLGSITLSGDPATPNASPDAGGGER